MREKKLKKKKPVIKLKSFRIHHKIIFTLLGVVGVILLWRGVWNFFDNIPFLNHPLVSVIFGFLLVILSGIFFKLI